MYHCNCFPLDHGPTCAYATPFCSSCGKPTKDTANAYGLHECQAARFCGYCGEQTSGPSIGPHTHHLCSPSMTAVR